MLEASLHTSVWAAGRRFDCEGSRALALIVHPEGACESPVLFLLFNRPETTRRVFDRIRRARPRRLYVAADGPRFNVPGEAQRCADARAVVEAVDWPCDVLTLLRRENLGCREAVSSAITWFFEHELEGIILEDDCLPDPSFFAFCGELLHRYRQDRRIMMISGNNFQFGRRRTDYSYYFSRYAHIWGWATWRRSWQEYDVNMALWPEIRDGGWLQDTYGNQSVVQFWRDAFEETYQGRIDTWDHQFTFACLRNSGLCIMPNANLVSNIGFGIEATRTTGNSPFSALPMEPLSFPLCHPPFIMRDARADEATEKAQFQIPRRVRVVRALKGIVR